MKLSREVNRPIPDQKTLVQKNDGRKNLSVSGGTMSVKAMGSVTRRGFRGFVTSDPSSEPLSVPQTPRRFS